MELQWKRNNPASLGNPGVVGRVWVGMVVLGRAFNTMESWNGVGKSLGVLWNLGMMVCWEEPSASTESWDGLGWNGGVGKSLQLSWNHGIL